MNDLKEVDKQAQSKSVANSEAAQSINSVSVTPPPYGNNTTIQQKEDENLTGTESESKLHDVPSIPPEDEGEVMSKMERFFQADFSNVKIHENSAKANELSAHAYTQGNDIYFSAGQYNPNTKEGQELLAHELTHVIQQRKGIVKPTTQHDDYQVNDDPRLETEANVRGRQAANSNANDSRSPKTVSNTSSNTIQKKGHQGQCGCSNCSGSVTQRKKSTSDSHNGGCGCVQCSPIQKKSSNSSSGSSASSAVTQFRLPTFSDLNDTATDSTIDIPKDVLKNRIRILITRMRNEGRLLNTTDSIDDIMLRLFDKSDNLVQSEYNSIVSEADRSQVYQNVEDNKSEISSSHLPRFRQVMSRAASLCSVSATMDTSLERIFGTKTSEAKTIYTRAAEIINRLRSDEAWMNRVANVDYNLDDPETGLGGYASYDSNEDDMEVHFSPSTVIADDFKESAITVLHEACHLADNSVGDNGYYPGSDAGLQESWAARSEDKKITNAAHFEEFPRRYNSVSVYARDRVFTPGRTSTGGTVSEEDTAKDNVREYYREAWSSALDFMDEVREIKTDLQYNDETSLNASRDKLIILSRLMNLTIHEQATGNETVTNLDITLIESNIRSFLIQAGASRRVDYTALLVAGDLDATRAAVVNAAIAVSPVMSAAQDNHYLSELQTKNHLVDL